MYVYAANACRGHVISNLRFAINLAVPADQEAGHGYGARSSGSLFPTYRFWILRGASMPWKRSGSSFKQSMTLEKCFFGCISNDDPCRSKSFHFQLRIGDADKMWHALFEMGFLNYAVLRICL